MANNKKAKLQKAVVWADGVADRLGKPIDAGIKGAVVALHALGIHTTASCEGRVGWGLAGPWIDIMAPAGMKSVDAILDFRRKVNDKKPVPKKLLQARNKTIPGNYKYAEKVLGLVAAFYKNRSTTFESRIIVDYYFDGSVRMKCQGTEPNSHRASKVKAANLEKYQKEFQDFTQFLLNRV